MAHLVASVSGVVLGGVAEVVGSNLARGKIFTASIGSVDSLYPSVYITHDLVLHIYIRRPFQSIPLRFATGINNRDVSILSYVQTRLRQIYILTGFKNATLTSCYSL